MNARLTENERWLVGEAGNAARLWLDSHPDGYLSTERVFADYVETLVAIINGLVCEPSADSGTRP